MDITYEQSSQNVLIILTKYTPMLNLSSKILLKNTEIVHIKDLLSL